MAHGAQFLPKQQPRPNLRFVVRRGPAKLPAVLRSFSAFFPAPQAKAGFSASIMAFGDGPAGLVALRPNKRSGQAGVRPQALPQKKHFMNTRVAGKHLREASPEK